MLLAFGLASSPVAAPEASAKVNFSIQLWPDYNPRPYWVPVPRPAERYERRYGPNRASRRHIEYCLNRYRSYNPRTDTYRTRSGRYRTCMSPYDRY